nr:phosphoglucomutase, alpha-D-glucose phosphate-specific [Myxococcota bacterium]
RANEILARGLGEVRRVPYERALTMPNVASHDFLGAYVLDLKNVVDIERIRSAGVRMGVDPLGGASLPYWARIRDVYGLDLEVVNTVLDPTFRFMTVDHDGKVRMDCSSPWAMAGLIRYRDRFDVSFGNDPDSDRHGIVTRSSGLMNPNAYLAVIIEYLFEHRPEWKPGSAVGKTLVSSSIIDRVAASVNRTVVEVPVGFKWFVDGLVSGGFGFAGEESAGASFLRRDGTVWTTDKDGIIAALLAAEITAVTGRDPGELYTGIEGRFGRSFYARVDSPADARARRVLANLSPDMVSADKMAGQPITARLTKAPGNGASIGGLKVVTADGWFAARPSGTEDIYKIYAESLRDRAHLERILEDARGIVAAALS